MNLRKVFLLFLALSSFQAYSCFIFEAVGVVTKLTELGFKIKNLFGGFGSDKKLDKKLKNIIKKLDEMALKMDRDLTQILVNQEIAPLLNKWWALRVQFNGKMDAIQRDISRNLSDIECAAIANNVIGDDANSIHQLIQNMYDTLFTHEKGALFEYMTNKIQWGKTPGNQSASLKVYDFYLGTMSLEMQAAIGLEFQFDVFEHVHPDHNKERRMIERNKTTQRVETTMTRFKEYMKTAKLHVIKQTYQTKGVLCLDNLQADSGFVISDFKLDFYPGLLPVYRAAIQQSKLGPMGLIDPKTSSWKKNEPKCKFNFVFMNSVTFENNLKPDNATHQTAFTAISMISPSKNKVKMEKKYITFDFETGTLDGKVKPNQTLSLDSFADAVIKDLGISKAGPNLNIDLFKVDYSVLI